MTKLIADFSGVFVLFELEREPCHGYKLRKNLKAKVGTLPNVGQIYPLLYRYENLGLLKSYIKQNWRGQNIRVYELTEKGKSTISLVRHALKKVGFRPVPAPTSNTHGF